MSAAKNQCESFEFAMPLNDLFMVASKGLIAAEENNYVENYPLLKCIASSKGHALLVVNADNPMSWDLKTRGLASLGFLRRKNIHYWSALHPYRSRHFMQ